MTPFTTSGFQFRFDKMGDKWQVTVSTKTATVSRQFDKSSEGYAWLKEIWEIETAVATGQA